VRLPKMSLARGPACESTLPRKQSCYVLQSLYSLPSPLSEEVIQLAKLPISAAPGSQPTISWSVATGFNQVISTVHARADFLSRVSFFLFFFQTSIVGDTDQQ
jgi:hypothetical protein